MFICIHKQLTLIKIVNYYFSYYIFKKNCLTKLYPLFIINSTHINVASTNISGQRFHYSLRVTIYVVRTKIIPSRGLAWYVHPFAFWLMTSCLKKGFSTRRANQFIGDKNLCACTHVPYTTNKKSIQGEKECGFWLLIVHPATWQQKHSGWTLQNTPGSNSFCISHFSSSFASSFISLWIWAFIFCWCDTWHCSQHQSWLHLWMQY